MAAGLMMVLAGAAPAQTPSLPVTIKLRTGGAIDGLVVEHSDEGLVIAHDDTPYVFAWRALDPVSATVTRRELMTLTRHPDEPDAFSAEDYFDLGSFALKMDALGQANGFFRAARKLDPAIIGRIDEALTDYRLRAEPDRTSPARRPPGDAETEAEETQPITADRPDATGFATLLAAESTAPLVRKQVDKIYRNFGRTVREVMGRRVTLVETTHFLIWTDWRKRYHGMLADVAESMYRSLCRQFGVDERADIFLAKCPMFCWRSKKHFVKFAQQFDGHDGSNAIGYTRSIERNGHVHVVLLRQGKTRIDRDRFASTLVHEGTHAFLHRLYAPRLIPNWVNEGLAEMMSERVLGDRSVAGEEAALLARVYVRYDWPITDLLKSTGPIGVEQYGLACSVVSYLQQLGGDRLAGMIRELKGGVTTETALSTSYDGLTLTRLESDWRAWIKKNDPVLNPPDTEDARLPWRH